MKKLLLLLIAMGLLSAFGFANSPSSSPNKRAKDKAIISNKNLSPAQLQLKRQELQLQQQMLVIKKQMLSLDQQQAAINRQQRLLNLKWMKGSAGKKPAKAVLGGYGYQKALYICHASYMEGTHPGFIDGKGCRISYGGKSYLIKSYQVLTSNQKLAWNSANKLRQFHNIYRRRYYNPYQPIMVRPLNDISSFPIVGGMEKGHPLYICRGIYQNNIRIGKVVAGRCNLSWEGREVHTSTYQVLFG